MRTFLFIVAVVLIPIVVVVAGFVGWGWVLWMSPEQELSERLSQPQERPALDELEHWGLERAAISKADQDRLRSRLQIREVYPVGERDEWLIFEFGGADKHYGIIVGSTEYPPASFPWPVRSQWRPRVWYYSEVE